MSEQETEERRQALRDLFTKHPAMHKAYHHDVVVHMWFKRYLQGEVTLNHAYINIIIMQTVEKETLLEQAAKLYSTQMPAPILLPHGARVLDEDASGGHPIQMPKIQKGSRISFTNFGAMDGITFVVKSARGGKLTLEREK